MPTQKVADHAEKMRKAATLRYSNPDATWEWIGEQCGVTRKTLWQWRGTEQWEITSRETADKFVADMASDAIAALRRAWKRGNPSGALEILRALSLLRGAEITVRSGPVSDLDEEINRLFLAYGQPEKPTT